MLFQPTSPRGDIRNEYPELSDIPEFGFDVLNKNEMLFVWAVVDKVNTYWPGLDYKERIRQSLKLSRVGKAIGEKESVKWIEGNIPDKIAAAIVRMDKFNPSVRMWAKLMAEKTLRDMRKDIFGGMATTSEKVDIVQKLPIIIKVVEEGYGFKGGKMTEKKSSDKAGGGIMDRLLAEEDDVQSGKHS